MEKVGTRQPTVAETKAMLASTPNMPGEAGSLVADGGTQMPQQPVTFLLSRQCYLIQMFELLTQVQLHNSTYDQQQASRLSSIWLRLIEAIW